MQIYQRESAKRVKEKMVVRMQKWAYIVNKNRHIQKISEEVVMLRMWGVDPY